MKRTPARSTPDDSLAPELVLTAEQEAELDRRLEEAKNDPDGDIPWELARAAIRKDRK